MIYVFLAEGFEEMEAIAPIDLLRRAGCDLQTVAIGAQTVLGAHGIPMVADITIEQASFDNLEGIVLPGGMPGTTNLEADARLQAFVDYAQERKLVIGAICAAPSILGHKGLLNGRKAICYPGFESALQGADVDPTSYVVRDGHFVTARGAGVATEFALMLVDMLKDSQTAIMLREGIQCR